MPQDAPNVGMTFPVVSKVPEHTTCQGGRKTVAVVKFGVHVKGTDQYAQYYQAKNLIQAVKTVINNTPIGSFDLVAGGTTVMHMHVVAPGEVDEPYLYQSGKGSGVQTVSLTVQVIYWDENSG